MILLNVLVKFLMDKKHSPNALYHTDGRKVLGTYERDYSYIIQDILICHKELERGYNLTYDIVKETKIYSEQNKESFNNTYLRVAFQNDG